MWLYCIIDRVSYTLSVQSQSCDYTVLLTAYPTRCQCSLSHVIILYYWPRILHAVSTVSVMWLYCITDRVSYTPSVQSQSCDYTVLLTAYPTRCQCSLSHVIILYYWPRILHAVSAVSVMWLHYITDRVSYTLSVQSQSCDYTVLLTAYPTRRQCSLSHVIILYYWPRILHAVSAVSVMWLYCITDRVSYTLYVQSQSCDYTVLLTAYPTRSQCSLSHVTILYKWPRILHAVSVVSVMWLYCITDRVSYTLSVQSQSCDYTVLLTAYHTRCQCSLSHVTILYYWPRIIHAVSAVSVMWLYCITDRVSYTLSVQSQSCDYTVLLTAYPTRCQCSLSHVIILYYWPHILHALSAVSVMWLYCIIDRVSYTLSVQSQSCDYTV